jgi:phage recombination protein Bet
MSAATTTAVKETASAAETPKPAASEVAVFQRPRLPWHPAIEEAFKDLGVSKATWNALTTAIFPAAKTVDSIILALSYCKARKLDPFKRPVHIVPVWDSAKGALVDTVWPGISELRTTAVRTGNFAGFDAVKFGPDKTQEFEGEVGSRDNKRTQKMKLTFPEWATLTVYRMIGDQRVAVEGPRVYWLETYGMMGKSEIPNPMWARRPRGQLEKCAEAAALRRAFPEELGSEYAAEEVNENFYNGTVIDASPAATKVLPKDAKGGLDALVDNAAKAQPKADTAVAGGETPFDPETGEVVEGEVVEDPKAEETAAAQTGQAIEEEDQAYTVAEKTTAGLVNSLADPEMSTVAQLDEFKTRAQDVIKALEITDDQKSVLLGRFNAAFLNRKKSLGAAKTTAKK